MAVTLFGTAAAGTVTNPALSIAVTLPASIVLGDRIELYGVVQNGTETFTTPTGYAVMDPLTVSQANATGDAAQTFARTADGSEGGTTVTLSIAGATTRRLALIAAVWRGVDTASPLDVALATPLVATTGSTFSTPTITTVTPGAVAVEIAAVKDTVATTAITGVSTASAGWTDSTVDAKSNISGTGNDLVTFAYKTIAVPAAAGQASWTASPANNDQWVGFAHALRAQQIPGLAVARTRT